MNLIKADIKIFLYKAIITRITFRFYVFHSNSNRLIKVVILTLFYIIGVHRNNLNSKYQELFGTEKLGCNIQNYRMMKQSINCSNWVYKSLRIFLFIITIYL